MIIFPGSFNPIHKGHVEIHNHISQVEHENVFLEICLNHPVKGLIDNQDLYNRIHNIRCEGITNIILSNKGLFTDKIKHYGYFTEFIVGIDTWNRIWDESIQPGEDVLEVFTEYEPKFFVIPRKNEPETVPLNDVLLNRYREMVYFPRKFEHLSSTEIRKQCQSN